MRDLLLLFVFPAFITWSAVTDLLRMTISNRVCLGLTLAFVVMALYTGMTLPQAGWHLAAAFIVLVFSFGCFAFGWIGGGDAKIAAATALWFGFDQLFAYVVIGSFFGGILTLGILKMRSLPLPRFFAKQPWIVRLHDTKTGIPYGIALAAGALAVYPQSTWMQIVGG
jgi:prepilin peptidase CpaA